MIVTPLSTQQTLERAHSVLEGGRATALPELLNLIEALSRNISEITVSEIVEVIEKDTIVLAKVISVANTLAHNPAIAPVSTLSQAIHQLGYNRIRTIAVSLMLLDSASGGNPPEQRDAAAHALCAGLIAQSVAEALGTHDPEFVFACATLRNFGHILMAAVSPEHCREAVKSSHGSTETAAMRQQFSLSPLDLSRRMLSAARLPAEVMVALRECEPECLAPTHYDARLVAIADFSSRLAALALDVREGPDSFLRNSLKLAIRFQRITPEVAEMTQLALEQTEERLRSFTGYLDWLESAQEYGPHKRPSSLNPPTFFRSSGESHSSRGRVNPPNSKGLVNSIDLIPFI